MIETSFENIFDQLPDAKHKVIVHGCNCLGVMGAGIAATIKKLYPAAFDAYKIQESTDGLHLGQFSWVTIPKQNITIVNLLTQSSTGGVRAASYDAIADGFRNIAEECGRQFDNLHSNSCVFGGLDPSAWINSGQNRFNIHFPQIGCGLGGGDWKIVETIIDAALPDYAFNKTLHMLK